MKTKLFLFLMLAAIISTGVARAVTSASPANSSVAAPGQFQPLAFSDTKEADMLRRAYVILATGDHDYKGHRTKAMRAIESAAGLLGLKLHGDDKDRQPQPLSDEKLREARGLLQNVLGASAVKGQKAYHQTPRRSRRTHQRGVKNSLNKKNLEGVFIS